MRQLFTSLLILSTAFTFAQSSNTTDPASQNRLAGSVYISPAGAEDCPIGFYASRRGGLQIFTASDQKNLGPGQGLHLTLHRSTQPAIQSVTVAVYATSLKARTLPLDSSAPDTTSKIFTLERQKGAFSLTEADIWMQQVGSIRWADLISVNYADGTFWHSTDDLKCRAVPSLYLPVNATATKASR
jgi:hypothetical protein